MTSARFRKLSATEVLDEQQICTESFHSRWYCAVDLPSSKKGVLEKLPHSTKAAGGVPASS